MITRGRVVITRPLWLLRTYRKSPIRKLILNHNYSKEVLTKVRIVKLTEYKEAFTAELIIYNEV